MHRLPLLLGLAVSAPITFAQTAPVLRQTDHSLVGGGAENAGNASAGVINIPQISLLPPGNPGRTPWMASDAGMIGVTKMRLVTDPATTNSFLLDVQNNGFPPPHADAVTDDIIVFPPELVPGAMATIDVPPLTRPALFHDVYDETGVFLSGPNGILNDNPEPGTDDAYLSSDPARTFSVFSNFLMVKYYVVDPAETYQFTNHLGVVTQLGTGYRAFIFMDDDHSPNFDFDDMIVGILPSDCTEAAECDDGNFCNGAEACIDNLCANGPPPVCDDGVFCNGAEICTDNLCVSGPPPVCDDGNFCNGTEACVDNHCANGSPPLCDDGNPCNGVETCASNACQPGTPVDCSPRNTQCTTASCDPGGADGNCAIVTPVGNGAPCDDGNFCTLNDACADGVCVASLVFGLIEWKLLSDCLNGPGEPEAAGPDCSCSDLNGDLRVDLLDVAEFQIRFEIPQGL